LIIMGMDVVGKAPCNETGEYFRNNIWWWHPLADYCQMIAPEITSSCSDWHTNDGDGLDDACARALADALQSEIDSGLTALFARRCNSGLATLPNQPCHACVLGIRIEAAVGGDLHSGGSCPICCGTGLRDRIGYRFRRCERPSICELSSHVRRFQHLVMQH
jgi:hypothetical protein